MQDKVSEAVEYFKRQKGFTRFFDQMIGKYRSLGRIGGTIRLDNLTSEEKEALSAFFRKDYHHQKSAVIPAARFAEALAGTRFAGVEIKDLIDGYAGHGVLTKAQEQAIYETTKRQFFERLVHQYPHPNCQLWLKAVIDREPGSRGIHLAYDKDRAQLLEYMENVLKALSSLPRSQGKAAREASAYERLPVFAHRITGNPHGFDIDTDQGRYLISALQIMRSHQEEEYQVAASLSIEEITELLDHFGLVRDDLLNFVTCVGLMGFDAKSGKPLPVWQAAYQSGSVLNVPLREMSGVGKCVPVGVCDDVGQRNVVFVLENSGVFSAVLDRFCGNIVPPMVCTHGQFRLATLMLLDRLAENATIYYSGDFDPEGLQMAQRLLERYKGRVKLWRYGVNEYRQCVSSEKLSKRRLQKLQTIETEELVPVRQLMEQTGQAGYQEQLIDILVHDVRQHQGTSSALPGVLPEKGSDYYRCGSSR